LKNAGDGGQIMQSHATLVARLLNKLVLDILPAAIASLIGGLLFTHYGLGRVAEPAVQPAPASAEMMQLLRDEHGLIVSFLNAQLAREKTELAADDATRHANSDAAAVANTPAETPAVSVPAKPLGARVKMTAAATAAPAPAPLVIARVQPAEATGAAGSPIPQLLIAKTVGLKDHVVSATHRVVSALGGIPNWIGQIGDRLGGTEIPPRPAADMVTAS
jgi:hypothetical protein